jgi:hypothetical protein
MFAKLCITATRLSEHDNAARETLPRNLYNRDEIELAFGDAGGGELRLSGEVKRMHKRECGIV